MTPDEFISRWEKSAAAELANSQSFLKELCDLLGVPQPDVTTSDEDKDKYVFEKSVVFNNGDGTTSPGRADLYRAGCFVLESKQGSERKAAEQAEALATVTKAAKKPTGTAARETPAWDKAMQAARKQAKGYAEAIPDEWPPFLIVVDVGFCFDLYADFSSTGKNYVPFPDPRSYRIYLRRLRENETRERLKLLWTDPHALDPSKHAADVSRDIAVRLATLAKSLEAEHDPEIVAGFLMRCLFTMFAEDVELIRKDSFTELLLSLRFEPHNFAPMVESLWEAMDEGKFSTIIREKLRHFNGKFFKDKTALSLTKDQLDLLTEAAEHKWDYVEPAIFGTLLERALDPVERHKLGAHYTPRAYVERLVMPTIIEPLREQWEATYASAVLLDEEGKRSQALKLLRDFHGELCETRVLDPACGSGNFLYVSMELMKRLEGEVVNALAEFDDHVLPGVTIDPHQFLGIEINPRAAALAELVLWIGFIQWHRRTRNEIAPPEPILKDYENIECRDAVLTWDAIEPVVDADGVPVTRWDGRTTKPHPVTGEEVPDEDARTQEVRYLNPNKAEWPKADYVVGNPPFIGNKRMARVLGIGYCDALRATYTEVPESADYVMYWWQKGATAVANGSIARSGLITTNSITQTFNSRVVANGIRDPGECGVLFAIPDHPWVDSSDGAAVRISMTVLGQNALLGTLANLPVQTCENGVSADRLIQRRGPINEKLGVGVSFRSVRSIRGNEGVCGQGMKLVGAGFFAADELSRMETNPKTGYPVVRRYVSPRDILNGTQGRHVIDYFGLDETEARDVHPAAYQQLLHTVKPEREQNRRKSIRELWWRFAWERPVIRAAIANLTRYIVTLETSKHRFFTFVESDCLWDGSLFAIALSDGFHLGVLSSKIHIRWALRFGARLEDRPRWNNGTCFDPYPFPITDDGTRERIREIAEQLDAHRKRQQEQHPGLTMTGMYNVLEKLRSGEPLTKKEQTIHEQGLVSVLTQIHDDLDAAVCDAYGWPHDLDDEEILQRLVDLNHERAEEESRGLIRWLRPEFQNPEGTAQQAFAEDKQAKAAKAPAAKVKKQPWPKSLPERMVAIQSALARHDRPAEAKEIAAYYTRARRADVAELLETLAAVGTVRQLDDGRFVAYKTADAA